MGVLNQFGTTRRVPVLFFKKTLNSMRNILSFDKAMYKAEHFHNRSMVVIRNIWKFSVASSQKTFSFLLHILLPTVSNIWKTHT